ncbi:glycerophosphodiester phosphodiesterase family protein [Ancylobacter defluvii]|uniref:glycerophosphodiester phosphodiesterase n=1 Tax=Ancylobacter defluvii TaxID=1282440 RepID=A0A9W6JUJ6_9HYPH|nr:glycerophosphodiester phosphodiesterase family protein [Ancylobacter defluvii]MBS7586173.1 glycerophosphodiester phosphodiesterase [Ancylobacter defluvii]GLK82370.1 glycerophosphoryl diester phosphodiesterase [Ancylobacter defluvii]
MPLFMSIRLPLAALALSLSVVPPVAAQEVSRLADVGPRPFHLVDTMKDGPLKDQLAQCKGPFTTKNFSISHRGAPLQFPEHTREGYLAAAQMGAGVIECDVAFTKDRELVCRHAQCDLHTTTDILARPELASKCSQGFQPADPVTGRKASAKCCTSDLTLAEFRSLKPKMDAGNPNATTVADYMNATPRWRTDLYVDRATLMSHKDYIELVKSLGLKFTPELKAPEVTMPFEGSYTQQDYAQQLINEYKAAGIDPKDVYAQSFQLDDVLYWLKAEPAFGAQAVYLDGRDETDTGFDNMKAETWKPSMQELADKGVKILAPPLWMLVTAKDGKIVPSLYAQEAKKASLGLIAWSLERSGPLKDGGGYYYQSIKSVTDRDGDTLSLLDVLARDIGVIGVFSDWPATTTFYANCMKLN